MFNLKEPCIATMKVSIPDVICSLLSLLLHHPNCRAAIVIWKYYCSQSLFCVIDEFETDCDIVPTREGHSDSKFSLQGIWHIIPLPVGPLERGDWVEALTWLKYTSHCYEEVAPAVDAFLDGHAYIINTLVFLIGQYETRWYRQHTRLPTGGAVAGW